MGIEKLQVYLPLLLVVAFFAWRLFKFNRVKAQIPELLAKGAVIVDVRSRGEFQAGSNLKSLNIPLDELESKAKTLRPGTPIIVCCASGTRSAMAASTLKQLGFTDVVNAGPWSNTLV